jgi:ABC-type multidrug transport system ATPase subunit
LLDIKDLNFSYNDNNKIINDLNITIKANSLFGILGHNGAGKTTLFRLITGLISPKTGSIKINGYNIKQYRKFKNLSYMTEYNGIYNKLTAFQNLEFRARSNHIKKEKYVDMSVNILKKLHLYDRANEKAGSWSNGMKKRLALACALIVNSDLLLLDEPTSGIDPESLDIIKEILQELTKKGTTIILSSHDLNTIEKICTNFCIIQKGNIIFNGKIKELTMPLDKFYLKLTKNYSE